MEIFAAPGPLPQSRRPTPAHKQDAVYATLLNRLASGYYRFGQAVMVREIAEQTGASKHPIMAALKDLRAEGFVVITAQVGCQVISPSRREIADFFVMFSRMEGVMAGFAAERRQESDLDRLRAINAQIARLPVRNAASGERYRMLNREFHTAIHQMGQSAALHARLGTTWAMSDFLISQSNEFSRRLREAAAEHDQIIKAIARGSAPKARAAMEEHILSFRLKVIENIHPGAGG